MASVKKLSARRTSGTTPKCPTCQMRQGWVVQETASRMLLVCGYCRHAWSVPHAEDETARARRQPSTVTRRIGTRLTVGQRGRAVVVTRHRPTGKSRPR